MGLHSSEILALNKKAERYAQTVSAIRSEVEKVIVGQKDAVTKVLLALLSDGHVLLEGVPGLAKTLLVRALSSTIQAEFVRIQFTPDLLPADIIGTKIYEHKTSSFKTVKGPVFSNFVLADEINRAPPKVQSALLEAMQEKQVTIQGETHKLKQPFMVLATQNPIESEGTYALPEAQVDRFMFKVLLDYPSKEEEAEILERYTKLSQPEAGKITNASKIVEMQNFVRSIYADEKILEYVSTIIDATRNPEEYGLKINGFIEYGASPRASIWAIIGAKANALLNGRGYVLPEDVKSVIHEVLRHRIILSYEAEAEGITTDEIIDQIMSKIRVP
ncbi:MoxR family ATPase [Candidatus Woesearchaeota archaeon]|nr:MAG: MoxR family ATPase [Candidatus Woesearchaeota archaeon]